MSPSISDPADEFLANIAEMRLASSSREGLLLRLSTLLMPLGIILGIVAWFLAYNTDNALDQRDAIVLALIGVSVSVVGVGLFLRYSIADFLRFWMARLILQDERRRGQTGTNGPETPGE